MENISTIDSTRLVNASQTSSPYHPDVENSIMNAVPAEVCRPNGIVSLIRSPRLFFTGASEC